MNPRPTLGALLLLLASSAIGCSAPKAILDAKHPLTAAVEVGLSAGTRTFDHSVFDRLLTRYVSETGTVDYSGLLSERSALSGYLGRVARADFSKYGREELLALVINTYNALTLDWILENFPVDSIRDTKNPWKAGRHTVGGTTVSLDFLEHSLLRVPQLFDEPRIHFGVNCAAKGCPPLRNEAFIGSKVRAQLENSVHRALAMESQLRVVRGKVLVSQIFNWFGDDFRRGESTLSGFLIPRAPAAAAAILREKGDAAIGFFDYDWSLNGA